MSDNEILVLVTVGLVLFFAALFVIGWLRGAIWDAERKAENAQRDYKDLSNRHWELWARHDNLLQHLGLVEKDEPKRTVLVKRNKK